MRKQQLRVALLALLLALVIMPTTGSALFENNSVSWFNNGGSTSTSKPTSSNYPHSAMQKSIADHAAINPDVVGWLTIPNTNMNFPITYSNKGNNYYVARDWRGTNYPNINYKNYVDTATYLDYRAQLGEGWKNGTSRNLVLYGHNWNNLRAPFAVGNVKGYSMFAQLPSYTDMDFAKSNPHIYFSTAKNEGIWRVFAVAYTEMSPNFFYNNPNPTAEGFTQIINEWKARSIYNFDVDVNNTDRIVTLSTCTRQYAAGEMQRYVVVARLLRDGESEADAVTVSVNSNVKQPKF